MKTANELVGYLFEVRDTVHVLHLKTNSYAQHIALNELYDGLLDLTDDIAETYQGKYGLLKIPSVITKGTTDAVEYVAEVVSKVEASKSIFKPEDTHLLNILDEIIALFYKQLYKLRHLK